MITISGPRLSGKTTELIKKYKSTGGYIIVPGNTRRNAMMQNYSVPKEDIFTMLEVENGKMRGLVKRTIYIDDLDIWVLKYIGGHWNDEIYATFTGEDITKQLTPLWEAMNK